MFWVICFPLYLFKRREYIRILREKEELKTEAGDHFVYAGFFCLLLVGGSFLNQFQNALANHNNHVSAPTEQGQSERQPSTVVDPPYTGSKELLGYQDINFRIGPKALIAKKKCAIRKLDNGEQDGLIKYQCENFPLNGRKVTGIFFFLDNELLRIAFVLEDINSDVMARYAKALTEKYGQPYELDQKALEAFDAGKADLATITWNTGQVALRFYKVLGRPSVSLMYSDLDFESKLQSLVGKIRDGI
jgi:hypothetical protein